MRGNLGFSGLSAKSGGCTSSNAPSSPALSRPAQPAAAHLLLTRRLTLTLRHILTRTAAWTTTTRAPLSSACPRAPCGDARPLPRRLLTPLPTVRLHLISSSLGSPSGRPGRTSSPLLTPRLAGSGCLSPGGKIPASAADPQTYEPLAHLCYPLYFYVLT